MPVRNFSINLNQDRILFKLYKYCLVNQVILSIDEIFNVDIQLYRKVFAFLELEYHIVRD